MSSVRLGRSQQQHNKGKRPVRPRKAAAPRREWVSTVSDLSVHKLTPAELSHRHEIHKSHNKAAAQWELREKALARRLGPGRSPAHLDPASLSIIREVFSDQLLLQDVLARSDRAMAVVKDLFGDAPRRHTGHPSVTMAPNCDSDSELPVLQRPDPPTQLCLLSQSMMDQQALNELQDSEEDHSDEDANPSGRSNYHVIRRTNVTKTKAPSRGKVNQQQKAQRPVSDHGDRDHVLSTPCTSGRAPDQTALNATLAVQRVWTRPSRPEEDEEEPSVLVSQVLNPDKPLSQSGRIRTRTSRTRKCISLSSALNGSSVASLSGNQSSLGLLQSMLGQVEADLDTMSPDTEPGSAQSPNQHRTQGLTGFSVALISTVGRLVHHLKKRDENVHKESEERRKLEEELRAQRGLIDALTAETMTLREEAAALQAGLLQRTTELEQKLDAVVLLIGGLGLLEAHTDPPRDPDVKAAACQSLLVPERIQASASPAFLLSPPRQSDNWQHIPVTQPVPSQQLLPLDDLCSFEDVPALFSASSLTSRPSSSSLSLTSCDPLSSQIPPEALLAEIAQLSRQNELIWAQLSQAKSLSSGGGVSPNSSIEQRRPSSGSSGRNPPQSVGERRTSGSSSSRRRSQNIQVADGHKATRQTTPPNDPSVSTVEQRLLELNRQSAAARGRLLELIEQQKHNVSSKVSPSVSPIPTSALSPQTAAGGSPDVSVLPPSQELQSQAGGERRSAGSEVSSHRYEGETRGGKTQMEKQREREGWFSLSAHVI
ncbi:spindle and centriole-associated protein 1 [Limanda limanda]|uniref:spindle and centriole-associated protein 1 n=1 Tax=Limanda limanda TaxID=27771 RepID=UPI0029C7E6FA|nr:spindle and centriole-associated protein 1 [Limanda limanda]